jgi:hypothetical protein
MSEIVIAAVALRLRVLAESLVQFMERLSVLSAEFLVRSKCLFGLNQQ